MNNYDYPIGADNESAPWNEKTKIVNVTISMTISKTVPIECNSKLILDSYELKRLVEEQVVLPTDSDSSWYIDDFVVNED
jgi:hypothetical protein